MESSYTSFGGSLEELIEIGIDCPASGFQCRNEDWKLPEFGEVPFYLSLTSCLLSVFGSILTVLPYILWKDIRTGVRKIITFLAIADFFTAFGYIIGNINELYFKSNSKSDYQDACKTFDTVCEIQSYISSWSSMSSFFWTSILALYLYWTIVKGNMKKVNKFFPIYHILAWGSPVLVVFPLLVFGRLGYSLFASGSWCFIKGDLDTGFTDGDYYRMSTQTIFLILLGGKALEIFTYIWVIIFYGTIFINIRKKKNKDPVSPVSGGISNLLKQVEKKLYLIPIAFICIRIWGTIEFIVSAFVFAGERSLIEAPSGCIPYSIYYTLYVLKILQCIGDGAQGWVNALLYIFWSPKIRQRLIINPLGTFCFAIATRLAPSSRFPDTLTAVTSPSRRSAPVDIQQENGKVLNDKGETILDTLSKDDNEKTPLIQSNRA